MDAWITENRTALVTDLYQLTMLQAYWREGLTGEATFDLFVRRLPRNRNYLLFCGLESILDYLENLAFRDEDIDYLATVPQSGSGTEPLFRDDFLEWLRSFRFTGDVRAMPEGSVFFPGEPVLSVTAPIAEAQLAETFLLNQVTVQTLLASKAARIVRAAHGRTVVDFGMRRAHGTDAAMKGARSFFIAGVESTSNVAAGRAFDIPLTGTMAHSYIEAHANEIDAFEAFQRLYPHTTLLIDTYDTPAGVDRVIDMANTLGDAFQVGALRLDSGDLIALSREVRKRLDAAGLEPIKLFASSSLDERRIAEMIAAGAPIDGFGVGTRMTTSQDSPTLDTVYKLAAYSGSPKMKLSEDKATLPGLKQVWRTTEDNGRFAHDTIGTAEKPLEGNPLLHLVMRDGEKTDVGRDSLEMVRERAAQQLDALPERLHELETTPFAYAVRLSPALRERQASTQRRLLKLRE